MTAELVETTKLYARMVAKIDADWIEPLAGHLIKKTTSNPTGRRSGQVVALSRSRCSG